MTRSELPPLILRMQRADFYPHRTGRIELIQTHISYVFLTGDYAYKVKKPVSLGFLDFSTIEKRRHYCYEELRLNKRLSPELYLQVLPVFASDPGFRLGTSAESQNASAVEYVLVMRQFSQDALFSRMFERNELKAEHFRELTAMLAKFHESVGSDEQVLAYGSLQSIRDTAEQNYRVTSQYIGRLQTQTQFDKTKGFTDRFLQDHAIWFEQRKQERRIRECHGDLHLNNICMWRNQIQIFDCIEFSPRFRNIDVMYEIAFLVMDLDFRNRSDLGNVFLNAYLEYTGDYWGAVLIPFHCSLRATVRAKVNSLLIDDETVAEEQKKEAAQLAERYYALAASYGRKRSGSLMVTCGLSASGKSTVASQLSQKLGAIHIRSDAVRKHLAGAQINQGAPAKFGEGIYTSEITRQTYARLLDLGAFLAEQGMPVILDATFLKREFRADVLKRARSLGVAHRILFCTAPIETLEDRVRSRSQNISDATAVVLQQQRRDMEPFDESELQYVVSIDTTKDISSQIERLDWNL